MLKHFCYQLNRNDLCLVSLRALLRLLPSFRVFFRLVVFFDVLFGVFAVAERINASNQILKLTIHAIQLLCKHHSGF